MTSRRDGYPVPGGVRAGMPTPRFENADQQRWAEHLQELLGSLTGQRGHGADMLVTWRDLPGGLGDPDTTGTNPNPDFIPEVVPTGPAVAPPTVGRPGIRGIPGTDGVPGFPGTTARMPVGGEHGRSLMPSRDGQYAFMLGQNEATGAGPLQDVWRQGPASSDGTFLTYYDLIEFLEHGIDPYVALAGNMFLPPQPTDWAERSAEILMGGDPPPPTPRPDDDVAVDGDWETLTADVPLRLRVHRNGRYGFSWASYLARIEAGGQIILIVDDKNHYVGRRVLHTQNVVYRFAAESTVPEGITVDPETGQVSGSTMEVGSHYFIVEAYDRVSGVVIAQQAYTFEVEE